MRGNQGWHPQFKVGPTTAVACWSLLTAVRVKPDRQTCPPDIALSLHACCLWQPTSSNRLFGADGAFAWQLLLQLIRSPGSFLWAGLSALQGPEFTWYREGIHSSCAVALHNTIARLLALAASGIHQEPQALDELAACTVVSRSK